MVFRGSHKGTQFEPFQANTKSFTEALLVLHYNPQTCEAGGDDQVRALSGQHQILY